MSIRIEGLTIEERIRLVEDLWDSIASEQRSLPITAAQKAELDRRLDAYELDRNPGRPASEIVTELRRRL